jgi:hypothetical protein
MPERITDINPIADTRREFLGLDQIDSHRFPRAIKNGLAEILDLHIFRGPTALAVGIPAVAPFLTLTLAGPGLQFQPTPLQRRTRQSALRPEYLPVYRSSIQTHTQFRENCTRGLMPLVLLRDLQHFNRKGVSGHLLGRNDNRCQLGREASLYQRQVASVLQALSQQLRRDPSSPPSLFPQVTLAGDQQQLLDHEKELLIKKKEQERATKEYLKGESSFID